MKTGSTSHRKFLSVLAGLVAFGTLSTPHTVAAAQAAPDGPVTFTKDIAPLLQRSCQNCHRPSGMAPMALLTYDDVRPWAKSIKRKTVVH